MSDTASEIQWPVDRSAAWVRALWRGLVVVLCATLIAVSWPSWRLLWLTQRATFLAAGVLHLGLWCVTISFAWSAGKWLALAMWRRPLFVRITPLEVHMELGPFGMRTYPWKELSFRWPEGVEREVAERMLAEGMVLDLRHVPSGEEISAPVMSFTRQSAESLAGAFRPYLRDAARTAGDSAQREIRSPGAMAGGEEVR